ncbi:MAG: ribokinase [Melioribacteraceae bacterium]|nr:MAG: ribokinase [Melioribacteraceae bacterium]
MNKEGVLVVGSANMDLVVFTKNFPKPGETVFGKDFQMFPGGKGANQAVACSRLGGKTYFLGKLGNDDFANSLYDSLHRNNIDLSYLMKSNESHTGMALITVDGKGENEIVVVSGTNMKLTSDDLKNSNGLFKEVKIVLTQLEIPTETVVSIANLARDNKAVFILNPAPAKELPNNLFPLIDYITPNETELEILSCVKINNENDIKTAASVLLEKGVKNIIVTLAEKGAVLINKERFELFPVNVVDAVDTTGAGDTFNGALAYSLSKNKSIDEAINFANHSASISVTRRGAQSSMPTKQEVKQILN